eukprot:7339454-Prymnesium_polylepis.1
MPPRSGRETSARTVCMHQKVRTPYVYPITEVGSVSVSICLPRCRSPRWGFTPDPFRLWKRLDISPFRTVPVQLLAARPCSPAARRGGRG